MGLLMPLHLGHWQLLGYSTTCQRPRVSLFADLATVLVLRQIEHVIIGTFIGL